MVQRSGAYDVNDRFELVVPDDAETHAHAAPSGPPACRALPFDRVTGGAVLVTIVIVFALFLRSRRRLRTARRLLADTPEQPAGALAPR